MKNSSCSACGSSIRWGYTERLRRMPVDAEPVPDGNIILVETSVAEYGPRIRVLKQNETPPTDTLLYVSHFTTCTQAAGHRRKRTTS